MSHSGTLPGDRTVLDLLRPVPDGSPMKLTIGVTGHRDLVPSEVPDLQACVRTFFDDLAVQFPRLELELLTGLAVGADQLVAEVALERGMHVVGVLPFSPSEFERDFRDEGQRRGFRRLLERVEVIELPPAAGSSLEEIRGNGRERDRQYAQLGVFISNHCHVLLALWDGHQNGQLGGTSNIVRYHLSAVMPELELENESPNLLADNENDLVFHVTCSRDETAGRGESHPAPLETGWITAGLGRQPDGRMPDDYALMLERLQDFGDDLKKHAREVLDRARGLLADAPDLPLPNGIRLVDTLYAMADCMALHFQRRFLFGLRSSYLLAVLMGLVFIVYSEFVGQTWLGLLFLSLFATGVLFHFVGERREWHRKYLDYRALAEGLRVQVYWELSGVLDARSAEFAYDNFLQKQDVDLAWIRHVMRSASLRRNRLEPADPKWVEWVAREWIGSEEGNTGQLSYYTSKARQRIETYRRTFWLGSLALWSGIGMAIVLVLFSGRMSEPQVLLVLILMGVLPLVAGIRDAYSHKKADKELIKQYQFMALVFRKARRLMDDADSIASRRRILRAVGNAALEEHAEWLLMHRERPLEHGSI